MVYRFAVTFIWLFWLVMVSLLIRSEYFPESASLYRLPISYVGRKVFTSDTGSDLSIFYKKTYVGRLMMEPSPPNERLLKGTIKLDWPVLGHAYRGDIYFTFGFNPSLEIDQFAITSKSEGALVIIEGAKITDRIKAVFRSGDVAIDREFRWGELERRKFEGVVDGLKSDFGGQFGLQQLPPGFAAGFPRQLGWFAASANLTRDDKRIDTLLIATEGDRDYWVKIWVTPSGEILLVQTSPLIGLSLENRSLMDTAS